MTDPRARLEALAAAGDADARRHLATLAELEAVRAELNRTRDELSAWRERVAQLRAALDERRDADEED